MEPFMMTCTSNKQDQVKQLILAYNNQLTQGCGVLGCKHSKCASSGLLFEYADMASKPNASELLFQEAVALSRTGFRKDARTNRYWFCPNLAPPLHCFKMDVLTKEGLTGTPDEVAAALVRGLADLQTLLHAFPHRAIAQYDAEVSLLQNAGLMIEDQIGLDIMVVHEAFQHATKVLAGCSEQSQLIANALSKIVPQLVNFMTCGAMEATDPVQYGPRLQLTGNALAVRAILVLLHLPALFDPTHSNSSSLHQLCLAIQKTEGIHYVLKQRLCILPPDLFRSLVVNVQQYISVTLYTNAVFINETIASATAVLALLYESNYLLDRNAADGIVPHNEFYNGAVNDIIDVRKDFIQYVKSRPPRGGIAQSATFTFAQHPFMLDLSYKSLLLHFHSRVEQEQEVQNTLHTLMAQHWLGGGGGPSPVLTQDDFAFKLQVDRHDLLRSTLQELTTKTDRYKKPLRVQFRGEDGVDEGGVKKEFFQLLVKQIFDTSQGMFDIRNNGTIQWFQPAFKCTMKEKEFHLIGLLFGLAIYNSVILDVQFPLVVYKKLLGNDAHLTIRDLALVDSDLVRGLELLLNFQEKSDETVETVFCRTLSVEYDGVVFDLVENGRNIPLTASNRHLYVEKIVRHYLVDSIATNFENFKRGFLEVCNNPVLKQIRPAELELLVVGSPVLDFATLRNVCKYDGYKKTDPIIVHFWDIVLNEMDTENQRKLLKFCTGSDRVPVGGLGSITFVIGKNGGESEMLPTSHTCFNHLLLPDYATKEKLKEKLFQAINNCHGFGLI